jgi:hypothetical protein
MNSAKLELAYKDELRYGDMFYDADHVFLLTNPENGKTSLINLETGLYLAQGTTEDIRNVINNRKLLKVPIGTKITLTAN